MAQSEQWESSPCGPTSVSTGVAPRRNDRRDRRPLGARVSPIPGVAARSFSTYEPRKDRAAGIALPQCDGRRFLHRRTIQPRGRCQAGRRMRRSGGRLCDSSYRYCVGPRWTCARSAGRDVVGSTRGPDLCRRPDAARRDRRHHPNRSPGAVLAPASGRRFEPAAASATHPLLTNVRRPSRRRGGA